MSRREDMWDCTRTERSYNHKVRRRDDVGRPEGRNLFQNRVGSRFRVRAPLLDHKGERGEARLGFMPPGKLTG